MHIFHGFKIFRNKLANVTCPACSRVSPQSLHKLRKNTIMLCPHCGYYFLGKEN